MPYEGGDAKGHADLAALLRHAVQTRPDEIAIVSRTSSWTWRAVEEASVRLASGYLDLGLRPGDRLASLMPNRPELLLHYLACAKGGLVATPLNYRYAVPEIDHALRLSAASMLIAHAERAHDVEASTAASGLPLGCTWYEGEVAGGRRLETLLESRARAAFPPPDPDAPAAIFFTSGSTGAPKGVTHTYATLGAMTAMCAEGFEIRPDDVMLPGSSLSHVAAYLLSHAGFYAGARTVVARYFEADELLPLIREQRPTLAVVLPAPLFALVRDHDAHRGDFSSVRLFVSGGDKVPAELETEFEKLTGLQIDEGYGMTEFGMAAMNPVGGPYKIGSVGRVNRGFSVSIRDESGREVGPGQEGRIWVKAPSVMVGYWENPAATAEVMDGDWIDSGDLMKADEDGYLWFCGRKKQILVHDGSNIYPQEVEEALLAHPAVESVGVVGVHDTFHGEKIRAYVSLRDPQARPTDQELVHFARERIAAYKTPEEIIVLDEMPLNATGKVDRVRLKKLAAGEDVEALAGGGASEAGLGGGT